MPLTPLPGEFLKKPDDPRLVAKATYKSRARSHVQIKAVEPVKNKTMEGAGAGVDMMREGTTGMPWSVKGKAPPIKKSKTASKSKRAKTTALADKSNAQTPKARSLKEVGSQKQKTSLPHSASFERRLSLVPSIRAEVATPSDIPPTTTVPKFIRPKKLHRARKLFVKKRPEGQEPDFQVFHDPLPDPEVVAPLPSEEHVSSAAPLDALPEPLAAEELQETIVDHEEESNEVQEAVDEPLENLMEPSIQTGEVEQSEDLEETTLSDAMDLFFDATSPKAVPKELYMQDEEIVILHEVMDEFNGGTIHLEPLLAEFSDPPDATVEPDPIAEKIIEFPAPVPDQSPLPVEKPIISRSVSFQLLPDEEMLEDELSSLSIQEEDHQQNTNSKRRVALPDTPFSDDDISRYGRTDFVTMGHSPLLKTVSFKGLKAFKLGKALPKTTDETDELLI